MDAPIILIVEDEQDIFPALALLLRAAGYQVVHAPDSLSALVWLTVHTPALVVLDLWVPVLAGKRLVHEIHARPGPALPVLLLTAEYLSADAVKALGAIGYLRKPFDLDEVLAVVKRVAPIEYSETPTPR